MGAGGAASVGSSAQIFISYRRDDAAGYARAVNDELVRCFGAERVFIDVDDINAGQPFSEIIQRSVGDSAVLLALIGKRWRGERDGAAPRIFEAGDFVRQEVAAGLAKGLRVIPVLLDGAAMPDPAQLPPDLGALAGRNALELDNTRFAADMARLVREVRGALGEAAAPRRRRSAGVANAVVDRRRRGRWPLAAIGALWQSQRSPAPRRADRRVSSRRPCRRRARRSTANGRPTSPTTGTTRASRERFTFAGEADALHGSASFLGVAARRARRPRRCRGRRLRHPDERNERERRQRHGGRASLPRPARGRRAPLRHADRGRQLRARADRVRRPPGGAAAAPQASR